MKAFVGLLCAAALTAALPAAAGAQVTGPPLLGEPVVRPDTAAVPEGAPARIVPEAGEIRLVVSLSERKLHLFQAGEVVRSYDVAVGKPAHPTPEGEFRVRRIIWNPRWVPPKAEWARGQRARAPGDPRNPMGRVKMFFREPDYYVHGTSDEESLGHARSHGCIRMRNADVVDLARIVMENGGAPRSPGWFQRVLNRIRSTREVRLSQPVALTIEP